MLVAVLTNACRRFDSGCRRFDHCCRRFGVSPFWHVAVFVVAVPTCHRYDRYPCVAPSVVQRRNLHMQSCVAPHLSIRRGQALVLTNLEQFPMIFDCCSVASSVRPIVNNLCSVIVGSLKPLSRTFDIAHLWMICDFSSLSFSWKLQCFASCFNRVLYWSRVSAAICSACLNLKISYSSLHCGLKY